MQQHIMAAFFAAMSALLFGSAAGEISHSRLPTMPLKVHHFDGALNVDMKEKEIGSMAMLELLRVPGSNMTELSNIEMLESTLADLTADKKAGKATPGMDNFAKTVTKMIREEMIPAIKKGHRDAKTTLKNFENGFRKCKQIRTVAAGGIKAMKLTMGSTSKGHKACRKGESRLYIIKEACKKVVEQKRKAKVAACGAFRALHRNPYSEANKCHPTGRVAYGKWLTGNRKFFQDRFKAFKAAKDFCRQKTIEWRKEWIACNKKIKAWSNKRSSCIKKQEGLEGATCALGKKMKVTCDKYDTCHDAQAEMYRKQKPNLMIQEKDRKGEFRALKRIDCLLQAVAGGADDDEIDECKRKTHGTKWLNLKYPKIPSKKKCPILPPIPGEKMFRVVEFRSLSKNSPAARVSKCVLSPAGGILMGVERSAKKKFKNYCSVSNGWLSARNGGSCLISERSGIPVQVNYNRARYTKFRFIMKMDEKSTRNAYKGGGGFAVCNNNALGWRSSSPAIQFVDAKKPSQWGYKLTPAWASNPLRLRKAVTCKQLMSKYKVWGKEAKGIDLSKYTGNKMKWMGCMGDGCKPKDFFCNQKRDEIVFGSKGTMRAVLGKKIPASPKGKPLCGSKKNPSGMFNPMDKTKDIHRLCKMMGYTRGSILRRKKQNFCPGVSSTKRGWGSNFRAKTSYGTTFRCQGPVSAGLYSSKKYYKSAEPSKGRSVQWSVTMMYYKGKYSLKQLEVGGRSFNGYEGKIAQCSMRGPYGFAPRIVSQAARGKVYIKDFRVFQGNSLDTKKMKQVVGSGVGRTSQKALKKKLRRAVRQAYRTFEVFRIARINIRQPTWYQMWLQAKKRGGRLMTYSEAKLFIDKRRGVLYKNINKNRDYWAAVTNPRERRAKRSGQGKKDWIQLGSRPHPPKTSHSARFGYPGWGDNSRSHRGGATTSVLLYVTKSNRKYVTKRVRITRVVRKPGGRRVKKVKIVRRKVVRPRPKPRPRRVCRNVPVRRHRRQVRWHTRCKTWWFFGRRRKCWRYPRYYTVRYTAWARRCYWTRR